MSKTPEPTTQDRIEKSIELRAPVAHVWHALTDSREFGAWFGVALSGPFTAGEDAHGKMTVPGYEHLTFHAVVQAIDPESYFAFTWHPYAVDPAVDYSKETPTLVEFRLEPIPTGTRLTVTESGFSDLPDDRHDGAYSRNNEGWSIQMKNIEDYLAQHP